MNDRHFDPLVIPQMSDEDLIAKAASLEQERTRISCDIEARLTEGRADPVWHLRARTALKHKRIQCEAIARELHRRTDQRHREDRAAKKAEAKRLKDEHLAARARKQERKDQQAAQKASQDSCEMRVFKEVARDVLGAEMYLYMWQEAHRRMEGANA